MPDTCERLRGRLEQDSELWSRFTCTNAPDAHPSVDPRYVDAYATNAAGDQLLVQVIRVETEAWGALAQNRNHTAAKTDDELVAEIYKAVHAKITYADPNVVLALDAQTSAHSHLRIVHAFRNQHGLWVRGLGFRAVWLVGPTTQLTYRLDV